MEHLQTTHSLSDRRARTLRAGSAAALALAAILLAGCSAGGVGSIAVDEAGESGAVSDSAGDPGSVEETRDVVIEGTMTVVVDDVTVAAERAADIVQAAGGRIDGRDEWNDDYGATTVMILRIPAAELDGALGELRALGDVRSLETASTDVTTAVQDVDARIASLESTIARLTSFQDQASTVTDLLSIEKEIAQRQAELEGYLARQADYAEQVAFSTITVTVQGVAAPVESAPDSFLGGLAVGWDSFAAFVTGLVIVLGVLLPWIVAAGSVAIAVVLLVRWIRRRRNRRRATEETDDLISDRPDQEVPQQGAQAGAARPL